MIGETRPEPMTALGPDWTFDPETGRTNSSPEFVDCVAHVAYLIRTEFRGLDRDTVDVTAGLIMAQLAHRFGLRPRSFTEPLALQRSDNRDPL